MMTRILVLAVLLFGAAAGRHAVIDRRPVQIPGVALNQLSTTLGDWQSTGDVPFSASIETLLGTDEYVNRSYRSARGSVGLYVGYYRAQRQGAAIHSPLNCLPGAGWQPISLERVPLGGSAAIVNRVMVQKGGTRQAVYYWYQSRDRVIASEYWSKFYLVADALRTGRADTALVRVMVPILPEVDGARAAFDEGRAFASHAQPAINNVLFR